MAQSVVFRADGNSEIGYGHFIRTLGIAGLIGKEFTCVYAIRNPTDYQVKQILEKCERLVVLRNDALESDEFLGILSGDEIVVLDNYNFTSQYQLKIRAKGCKVVYI